jgi:glycosyltransferase involved in cell wall biosynthesis
MTNTFQMTRNAFSNYITPTVNNVNNSVSIDQKNHNHLLPELLFITSYPPRECGIATYSQDLLNAINNKFTNTFACSICALESMNEQHTYLQEPKYILNTDEHNSFIKTAVAINNDEQIKVVVIQHEFGFFAKNEIEFKIFFEQISKPIVFVFHTVLPMPDTKFKIKVQQMAAVASSIVVMTNNAAEILMKDYAIPKFQITVIQHGTHLVPPLDKLVLKHKFDFTDKLILSTFGLLSSSKGIETSLDALPAIIKLYPNVLFLILGKTHPTVFKNEGEIYREFLHQKIVDLGLEQHVQFVNEYLQLDTLLAYLQLTDIYLFTSKDPNQAVSGTFSYALSAGCPIVSTPIPHAQEILDHNCGVLIDFQNSKQLSNAVINLLQDEHKRKEITLNGLHKMASTAWENAAIAHVKLFESIIKKPIHLNYKIPIINLRHIKKMTTNFGMIQFSKIAQPDMESGYALDDNARALLVTCQLWELDNNQIDYDLIETYLNFIEFCQQPNGQFLNYVNESKQFTNQNDNENLDDSNGRTIWSLGYLISLESIMPQKTIDQAKLILQKALPHAKAIHSSRAMAFIIKGLYYQNDESNYYLIKIFADRLVQMYRHECTDNWLWFENCLTYGNSCLPESLLCAYLITNNIVYKNIAKDSFDFLLSKIFIGNKISVISNKGWCFKNQAPTNEIGGEQPIDVAYTIVALEKFYSVFQKNEYKRKMVIAFNWFLGENHLHQIVYNPCTGGCYDGLEEKSVNLNQGAESTLSYLIARLAIHRNYESKTPNDCLSKSLLISNKSQLI